jgi:tRNA wybutosine-synthesizing protein 1
MDQKTKEILEKQQNRFAGKHTAVKICTWAKNSLREQGVCYKQKFYGINSHRCVQMSPAVGFCHNRCIFCWRPLEYNEGIDMKEFDDPKVIIDNCITEQKKLLMGFGGNDNVDKDKLKESMNPLHFAISLTGEPTIYPKLSELIADLNTRKFSTFVVTNGMEPKVLKNIEPPTQLYLSVDAPSKELFEKIDQSILKDGWDRLNQSLIILNDLNKTTRTAIRFTLIKGLNMEQPEKWAKTIEIAKPMFVEVKAYMHVGFSKDRLKMENMPIHSEVKEFAKEIIKHSDYKIVDEHERSRVVLLMKEDFDGRVMVF